MKKTNPLKIVEIENYANNLRKELGIPSNSFFPVLEVMEKFHVDGLLTIQYLEDDDSLFEDDTPAKYNPADNFIYVKESVLEELEKHEQWKRYTHLVATPTILVNGYLLPPQYTIENLSFFLDTDI